MEPVTMNISTNNKFRNNFVTNRSLYSYPSDDLLFLTTVLAGGHFTGPSLLSLSNSYPPASLGFNRQQPPLLPLPVNHMNMNIYRSNSTCNNNNTNNNIRLSNPLNKKNVKTRGRDHSVTPKKSKNPKQNHKRDEKDVRITETSETIGPDPKDLPKDVIARVFSLSTNNNNNNNKSCETVSVDVGDDKFSGSVVFTPSPPPSSLPLPTFSLRPKLGCNAQAAVAAGVDAEATDSLRRLLRL